MLNSEFDFRALKDGFTPEYNIYSDDIDGALDKDRILQNLSTIREYADTANKKPSNSKMAKAYGELIQMVDTLEANISKHRLELEAIGLNKLQALLRSRNGRLLMEYDFFSSLKSRTERGMRSADRTSRRSRKTGYEPEVEAKASIPKSDIRLFGQNKPLSKHDYAEDFLRYRSDFLNAVHSINQMGYGDQLGFQNPTKVANAFRHLAAASWQPNPNRPLDMDVNGLARAIKEHWLRQGDQGRYLEVKDANGDSRYYMPVQGKLYDIKNERMISIPELIAKQGLTTRNFTNNIKPVNENQLPQSVKTKKEMMYIDYETSRVDTYKQKPSDVIVMGVRHRVKEPSGKIYWRTTAFSSVKNLSDVGLQKLETQNSNMAGFFKEVKRMLDDDNVDYLKAVKSQGFYNANIDLDRLANKVTQTTYDFLRSLSPDPASNRIRLTLTSGIVRPQSEKPKSNNQLLFDENLNPVPRHKFGTRMYISDALDTMQVMVDQGKANIVSHSLYDERVTRDSMMHTGDLKFKDTQAKAAATIGSILQTQDAQTLHARTSGMVADILMNMGISDPELKSRITGTIKKWNIFQMRGTNLQTLVRVMLNHPNFVERHDPTDAAFTREIDKALKGKQYKIGGVYFDNELNKLVKYRMSVPKLMQILPDVMQAQRTGREPLNPETRLAHRQAANAFDTLITRMVHSNVVDALMDSPHYRRQVELMTKGYRKGSIVYDRDRGRPVKTSTLSAHSERYARIESSRDARFRATQDMTNLLSAKLQKRVNSQAMEHALIADFVPDRRMAAEVESRIPQFSRSAIGREIGRFTLTAIGASAATRAMTSMFNMLGFGGTNEEIEGLRHDSIQTTASRLALSDFGSGLRQGAPISGDTARQQLTPRHNRSRVSAMKAAGAFLRGAAKDIRHSLMDRAKTYRSTEAGNILKMIPRLAGGSDATSVFRRKGLMYGGLIGLGMWMLGKMGVRDTQEDVTDSRELESMNADTSSEQRNWGRAIATPFGSGYHADRDIQGSVQTAPAADMAGKLSSVQYHHMDNAIRYDAGSVNATGPSRSFTNQGLDQADMLGAAIIAPSLKERPKPWTKSADQSQPAMVYSTPDSPQATRVAPTNIPKTWAQSPGKDRVAPPMGGQSRAALVKPDTMNVSKYRDGELTDNNKVYMGRRAIQSIQPGSILLPTGTTYHADYQGMHGNTEIPKRTVAMGGGTPIRSISDKLNVVDARINFNRVNFANTYHKRQQVVTANGHTYFS